HVLVVVVVLAAFFGGAVVVGQILDVRHRRERGGLPDAHIGLSDVLLHDTRRTPAGQLRQRNHAVGGTALHRVRVAYGLVPEVMARLAVVQVDEVVEVFALGNEVVVGAVAAP